MVIHTRSHGGDIMDGGHTEMPVDASRIVEASERVEYESTASKILEGIGDILGQPDNPTKAEDLKLLRSRMDNLVQESENYSGKTDQAVVSRNRLVGMLDACFGFEPNVGSEFVAKIIQKNPDLIYLMPVEKLHQFLDGLTSPRSGAFDKTYGSQERRVILAALAADGSPLTAEDKEKAEFF